MRGLQGKIALVTGGAQGLGQAIAKRLSEEGCVVWLADINGIGGETAALITSETGNPVYFVQVDISQKEEVDRLAQKITNTNMGLHILINNAATFVFKGVTAKAEDWDNIVNVNLKGTTYITNAVLPLLEKAKGASIVNLSSVSGFIGQSQFATYNATKFAIRGLTKCWAVDLASKGIRVNALCPGYIRTQAFDQSCRILGIDIEEEDRRVSALHILGRQGSPNEVAAAAAFLASDDASFITGSDLLVDGGFTAL